MAPRRGGGRPLLPAADNAFARALRGGREALGLTLMETAARAGVSHAYISELERGLRRPSPQTIDRLGFVLEGRFERDAVHTRVDSSVSASTGADPAGSAWSVAS